MIICIFNPYHFQHSELIQLYVHEVKYSSLIWSTVICESTPSLSIPSCYIHEPLQPHNINTVIFWDICSYPTLPSILYFD